MNTIQTLADEMFAWFKKDTRTNGKEFWKLKDGAPKWMQGVCLHAHDDMMPDDWKYEFITDALSALGELEAGHTPEDVTLPEYAYHAQHLDWLSSHLERMGYVDEYAESSGGLTVGKDGVGISELIQGGFYWEQRCVCERVVESLREHLDTLPDEAEETEA